MLVTWSEMRRKLEQEYLSDCLKEHIQYYVTTYRKSADDEGRAAIRLDGKEVLQGNYFNTWHRWRDKYYTLDDRHLNLGAFDQRDFYAAFWEFDNQSIEKSLQSENLIVRIFAVLDRRIGKRRLLQMQETIQNEPVNFQTFYVIRMEAEGLLNHENISSEECL